MTVKRKLFAVTTNVLTCCLLLGGTGSAEPYAITLFDAPGDLDSAGGINNNSDIVGVVAGPQSFLRYPER